MENKEIFFSLRRLLDKFSISEHELPTNLKKWRDFVAHVNDSFYDFEQEHYLLERSMELSSAEYVAVNERFEEAEAIARIGHWHYLSNQNKIFFSKEIYVIFGVAHTATLSGYLEFLNFVHEEDRAKLQATIASAMADGTSFEMEIRFYYQIDHSVRWVLIKCKSSSVSENEKKIDVNRFNLSGIIMDIDQQKKNEAKLRELNAQLVEMARRAGMSEVAISVLHNIGNILNSAGVSLAVMRGKMMTDRALKLKEVAHLLEEGIAKKIYVFPDEKGHLISKYLNELSKILMTNQQEIKDELDNLDGYFKHITSIVLMQHELSGRAGIHEKITVQDLLEQAVQMCYDVGTENVVKINKHYEFNTEILINRTKALQIVVNLLSNAKQAAVMCGMQPDKKIDIHTQQSTKKGFFDIVVSDNGVGIEKEAMKKIFMMGYTTKKDGHGFGLHMSAIAAHELGGKLAASSPGLNQGAVFTLTLPIHPIDNDRS